MERHHLFCEWFVEMFLSLILPMKNSRQNCGIIISLFNCMHVRLPPYSPLFIVAFLPLGIFYHIDYSYEQHKSNNVPFPSSFLNYWIFYSNKITDKPSYCARWKCAHSNEGDTVTGEVWNLWDYMQTLQSSCAHMVDISTPKITKLISSYLNLSRPM